ncbi:hypothetical protein OUZ56_012169 [Daphnia magna]|uniref:Uncharacterized protein n=1 Tax=Daphnia magna TaxID=35525 RepID=A0ABQ9Z3K0_9CRUS|nr:hypothetical protein OUZ56_012169 [Daphnia magna]
MDGWQPHSLFFGNATGNIVSALQCTPKTNGDQKLRTFTPCYWAGGIVNFNEKPHAYRNNTCLPVKASIVIPQHDLADAFRYQDVNFFEYQHQTNPAYTP